MNKAKKREQHTVYGVILAGGQGERLWPLSTKEKPKQLLSIANNKTLLAQTFERLSLAVPSDAIWVTTKHPHERVVIESLTDQVIVEPIGRNTAAAILLSCLRLAQKNPDAVVAIIPADHYIPESAWQTFARTIKRACTVAYEQEKIVLLGIQPTKSSTAYGYIEYQEKVCEGTYRVQFFHEKPSLAVAQQYVTQKNMLWNAGIFCGKVTTFVQLVERYAPQLFGAMEAYIKGEVDYSLIPAISFDHAVMEQCSEALVIPAQFEWYDVGTIDAFLSLKRAEGAEQKCVMIDARNNLVEVPNKLVALVGVDDVCVVEVDHVLLIIKRNQVDQVRSVVQNLKEHNELEYL